MYKKCRFLDDLQFNNVSMELRDLLMDIILSAVKAFTSSNICVSIQDQTWSSSIKYQVNDWSSKVLVLNTMRVL